MHRYRSHTCAALTRADVGETVRLSGWVHRVRDHGGVLFIDLRDHYGVTQVLCDGDSPAFRAVERVRAEWVIRIDGEVKARAPELVNPKIPTGEIEVFIREMEVLSEAAELPLPVFGEPDYPEETRLKYRFLDLRRESLHRTIMLRSRVVASLRHRMMQAGFTEFQTPILTASSPEGARDFLVPSRPASGQVLRSAAGAAAVQAARSWSRASTATSRSRPASATRTSRADRSPGEFYQLDFEMSFVDAGGRLRGDRAGDARRLRGIRGGRPRLRRDFPRHRLSRRDAVYGTDKPDLSNPIRMAEVTEHFAGVGVQDLRQDRCCEGRHRASARSPRRGRGQAASSATG
jgi:aspartyl-tRNA synthetase